MNQFAAEVNLRAVEFGVELDLNFVAAIVRDLKLVVELAAELDLN